MTSEVILKESSSINETLQRNSERVHALVAQVDPTFLLFQLRGKRIDFDTMINQFQLPLISQQAARATEIAAIRNESARLLYTPEMVSPVEFLDFVLHRLEVGDFTGNSSFDKQRDPGLPFNVLGQIIRHITAALEEDIVNPTQAQAILTKVNNQWGNFIADWQAELAFGVDPIILANFQQRIDVESERLRTQIANLEKGNNFESVLDNIKGQFEQTILIAKADHETDDTSRQRYIASERAYHQITAEETKSALERLSTACQKDIPSTKPNARVQPEKLYKVLTDYSATHFHMKSGSPPQYIQDPMRTNNQYFAYTSTEGQHPTTTITADFNDPDLSLEPILLHEQRHQDYAIRIHADLQAGRISQEFAGLQLYFHPPSQEGLAICLEDYLTEFGDEIGEPNLSNYNRKRFLLARSQADYDINIACMPVDDVAAKLRQSRPGEKPMEEVFVAMIINGVVNQPCYYLHNYVVAPDRIRTFATSVCGENKQGEKALYRDILQLGQPSIQAIYRLQEKDYRRYTPYQDVDFSPYFKKDTVLCAPVRKVMDDVWELMISVFPTQAVVLQIINSQSITPPIHGERWFEDISPKAKKGYTQQAQALLQRSTNLLTQGRDQLCFPDIQALEKACRYCQSLILVQTGDLTLPPGFLIYDAFAPLMSPLAYFRYWGWLDPAQRKTLLQAMPFHIAHTIRYLHEFQPQRAEQFIAELYSMEESARHASAEFGVSNPLEQLNVMDVFKHPQNFDTTQQQIHDNARMAVAIGGHNVNNIYRAADNALKNTPHDCLSWLSNEPVDLSLIPLYERAIDTALQEVNISLPARTIQVSRQTTGITGSTAETDYVLFKTDLPQPQRTTYHQARDSLIEAEIVTMGVTGLRSYIHSPYFINDWIKRKLARAQQAYKSKPAMINSLKELLPISPKQIRKLILITIKLIENIPNAEFPLKIPRQINRIMQITHLLYPRILNTMTDDELRAWYRSARKIRLEKEVHQKTTGSSVFDHLGLVLQAHEKGHLVYTAGCKSLTNNKAHPAATMIVTPETEGWMDAFAIALVNRIIANSDSQGIINPQFEKQRIQALKLIRAAQAKIDIWLNIDNITPEQIIFRLSEELQLDFSTTVSTFLPMIVRARNNPTMLSAGYFMGGILWESVLTVAHNRGYSDDLAVLLTLRTYEPQFIINHPQVIDQEMQKLIT